MQSRQLYDTLQGNPRFEAISKWVGMADLMREPHYTDVLGTPSTTGPDASFVALVHVADTFEIDGSAIFDRDSLTRTEPHHQ